MTRAPSGRPIDQIEALYRDERGWMEHRAARIVGTAEAQDVVQNVFLRVWARAKEHVPPSPAWLARVLRNAAVDSYRQDRRQRALIQGFLPEQLSAPAADAAQTLSAQQDLAQMEAALAALPERSRHVFLMNRAHGCSYDEIAAALDISYSTVERDIARALMACRAAMGDLASG